MNINNYLYCPFQERAVILLI